MLHTLHITLVAQVSTYCNILLSLVAFTRAGSGTDTTAVFCFCSIFFSFAIVHSSIFFPHLSSLDRILLLFPLSFRFLSFFLFLFLLNSSLSFSLFFLFTSVFFFLSFLSAFFFFLSSLRIIYLSIYSALLPPFTLSCFFSSFLVTLLSLFVFLSL